MTCFIPDDVERELAARANERQTTTEVLVVEALTWYLRSAPKERPETLSGAEAVNLFRQLQQNVAVTPQSAADWKAALAESRR
jgi:hypothetical protein